MYGLYYVKVSSLSAYFLEGVFFFPINGCWILSKSFSASVAMTIRFYSSIFLMWRIDAFKLWCWRRLLRVPWTARRSNQSILKEISSEYSLEGLMLKLKLQYFGPLMWRIDSLEKTLLLGKIEGRRRSGRQTRGWHHWLDGHEFE